jgi:arabinan endo-1,5-alpha-L-arabinosidase
LKKLLFTLFFVCLVVGLAAESDTYTNPVISSSTPDPTVIRADDGYFYLYATENIHNVPIYRSPNLVDWTFLGTAFTDATRPNFEPNGGIWAPDINFINGKYVLYYSMSVWGGEQTCGVGVATARTPSSHFTDMGKLFRSNEIGVQNSIDPFYIEDNGNKYLFWGSFHGIFCVELSEDGLSLKNPEKPSPQQVAGTAFEGTYIYKHGNYYYLFASVGSCCNGLNSTYQLVVGRSESLTGPYFNKQGQSMMNNAYSLVVGSSSRFVGNGHCSEIVQDDNGTDWIFFHGYDTQKPENGRVLLLNKISWDRAGWPYVEGNSPSVTAPKPVFSVNATNPVTNSTVQLQTVGKCLIFKSLVPASVKIYAVNGQLIKDFEESMSFQVSLASGIYLVQINTEVNSIVKKIFL